MCFFFINNKPQCVRCVQWLQALDHFASPFTHITWAPCSLLIVNNSLVWLGTRWSRRSEEVRQEGKRQMVSQKRIRWGRWGENKGGEKYILENLSWVEACWETREAVAYSILQGRKRGEAKWKFTNCHCVFMKPSMCWDNFKIQWTKLVPLCYRICSRKFKLLKQICYWVLKCNLNMFWGGNRDVLTLSVVDLSI